MFCYPSTRWEFNTFFTSLSLDGQGQLLRADPHRALAIFHNAGAVAATIFPGFQPEIAAVSPFQIEAFDTLLVSVFDYADLTGQAWFGVSPSLGELVTTELLPTSNSPQIKAQQPDRKVRTEFRRPEQFQNVDTTTLFSRNTMRIALILRTGSGTYSFGIHFPIGTPNAIVRLGANQSRTLLFKDYGPLIWEAWWGTDTGGSGSAPEFWEIVEIPEPIDCLQESQ